MINTYKKIIFVCNGNTCRSPMAATIMQSILQGYDVLVDSKGMVVLFPENYNPKAVAVAASHGMVMTNETTEQIDNSDFDSNTLVLVLDSYMKDKLYDEYSRAINVYTLGEFVGIPDWEVKDPYGRGMEEYNKCFETISEVVEKVAAKIIGDLPLKA